MRKIPDWLNSPLPIVPKLSELPKWIENINKHEPIRTGLHTTIHFAEKKISKTQRVYLYLHGFGCSINEVSPLTAILAKKHNANAIYQRLYRQGTSLAPLEYMTPKQWYYSALQGLAIAQKLGKEVIIVSCSTGSTLSMLLSARNNSHKEMLHQVLISPNFWPTDKILCHMFLNPLCNPILINIPRLYLKSKHRIIHVTNQMQQDNVTVRSPISALRPMMELVRLTWTILHKNPNLYATQTTIIANPNDKTVSFPMTKKFFKKYPFPHHLAVYDSEKLGNSHVIAGDMYSPQTTKEIAQIINKYTKIVATGPLAA